MSEKKPAASNDKKAGVDERHISTHNEEVRSRKPRPAKKLDYPENQTRRPRRDNEEVAVAPSDIARAGEALLAKPSIQRAITAALVANQNDSFEENNNNQSINQTELPSRITTPATDATPLIRHQHKLLDQAQIRATISRAEYEYLETLESHSGEDAGADAGTAGHGAGQAASTENETTLCCVCLDAHSTHIFVPCCHFCICSNCQIPYENGTVRECPMCREKFTQVSRVFH